jgi:hypothetical protein
MKKWIFFAALAVLAWQYMDNPSWQAHFSRPATYPTSTSSAPSEPSPATATVTSSEPAIAVSCDGRKYCSQMTSCAEAKAFLRSCPGMKMDGDGDGVPCEDQWCRM